MSDRRGFTSKFKELSRIAVRKVVRETVAEHFRDHLMHGETTIDLVAFRKKVHEARLDVATHILNASKR